MELAKMDDYMDELSEYLNISVTLLSRLSNESKLMDSLHKQDQDDYQYCGQQLALFGSVYRKMHGYISLIVCLFGMVANSLNIIVLTRKDMISPTNAILTGLAFADNLVMIEYIPFAVHMYILAGRPVADKFTYPWTVFVLIHAHVSQVFHTISIWITVLLAVWRYVSVAHPLYSRNWCTLDRALTAILIAYVCCPILCMPMYLTTTILEREHRVGANSYTIYTLGPSELATTNDDLLQKINLWIYSIVGKIVPCVALTILSLRLVQALVSARKRKDMLKSRNASSAPAPTPAINNSRNADSERHTNRTTRMLLAVLFLFVVTEFPQGILALLSGVLGDNFYKECYANLQELMDILALINGAINFILYFGMSRQFRKAFQKLARFYLCGDRNPERPNAARLLQRSQAPPSPQAPPPSQPPRGAAQENAAAQAGVQLDDFKDGQFNKQNHARNNLILNVTSGNLLIRPGHVNPVMETDLDAVELTPMI